VAVTATATEINLIDGGATVGTTAFADGDGILHNDGGTMKVTSATTLKTYMSDLTLTTAAQGNVTSLGTLTALTVDDVAVDGKVITMTGSSGDTFVTTVGANGATSLVTVDGSAAAAHLTITADGTVDINSAGVLTLDSGAAINIEPAAGSAILLDGTISIDAGVVTGATSITSTAFVGDITGDVTGTADVATVATTVTITDNESTNESNALIFTAGGDVDGGNLGLESDGTLTYNPSTGKVTATGFIGGDVAVTGAGNRQMSITSSDGIASMEIGAAADNPAFIDFKTPTSDDFDVRIGSLAGGAGGSLTIAGGTFSILGSGETMAAFADDGAVSLYHNNVVKFATQSGGVTVTGVVAATTMTGTVSTATQNSITTMTGLVTTGALNSGTITSGFGTINNGASTITTTGAVATGTVTAGGAITSTGNITAYSSDPRLKNFKGKISNALEKLNKINGYYYEWNDIAKGIDPDVFKDGVEIGVDASEIEAIMPEIIDIAPIVAHHNLDVDYKTVHYDLIVPLLIEAVKELQAEVIELKSKGVK
jgi:hypothetical protein